MSTYSELCAADNALLGLGRGSCGKVLGYDKRFFLTRTSFSFANVAAAKLETNWDAGIDAQNIFPFPEVQELEPQNVEASFYETPSGATYKTKDEKRKTLYKFIENISVHAAMKSYDGQEWNVFYITEKGYLRGHTQADGTIKGLPLSTLYVNAQETALIGDAPNQSPVILEFKDVNHWDKEYFVVKLENNFLIDKEAPYELDLNPETATTGATFVFDINVKTGDGTAVDGLLLADFVLIDAAGLVVTIDTVTPDGTIAGKYTVTATDTMTEGTIGLDGVVDKTDIKYQAAAEPVSS